MLLAVEADAERWLADVGFGGEALLLPVPWRPGEIAVQFDWQFRLMTEEAGFLLQMMRPEGWLDLYGFDLSPQYAVDYEVANHYTATYPDSFFLKKLMVHLPGPSMRLTLVNRRMIERRAEGASETVLPGDEAILGVLAERFGLHFPVGTRFPYLEDVV